MEMRLAAERILFSSSLEEKLQLPPDLSAEVTDDMPGDAISLPDQPGRPDHLVMSGKGIRVNFPGVNKLDDDRERGRMLHFLANHELLAAELMALVLLRFPDAPAEYRRGVYEAMREEQMHTRMYLRRMKECGVQFGELPLNDYFWKLVAPMETPMDFVTRLNLTFEQANLDFSKHYAGLFRQAGDAGTATVLEKIYQDEIGHVGHGVKWFRRWKKQGESDWEAFKTSLTFPLAPAKAKGMAPFNPEGRRQAGLDEDFINQLEVCEQSRGRTPVVHWFNPNAESYAAAALRGGEFHPNKMESAMETDLEMLTIAWCRKDDIALLRQHPGTAHLAYLKRSGFDLPEIVGPDQLAGRKLGGMRPWAWSPDASKLLEAAAGQVSANVPWQWRESLPAVCFSKEMGAILEEKLGQDEVTQEELDERQVTGRWNNGLFLRDSAEVEKTIVEMMERSPHGVLLKAAHACAGRGHRRVRLGEAVPQEWIRAVLGKHGGLCVEPFLEKVHDFSVLYEAKPGALKIAGMTHMENDANGRFLGSVIYPKWGAGLPAEIAEFLFREENITSFYNERLPRALSELLPSDYAGPVGVDAMVYRNPDGSLGLRSVVEVNVRMTMGRVALELHRKVDAGRPGRFRILRKKSFLESELFTGYSYSCGQSGGSCSQSYSQIADTKTVVINNPESAEEFIGVFQSGV